MYGLTVHCAGRRGIGGQTSDVRFDGALYGQTRHLSVRPSNALSKGGIGGQSEQCTVKRGICLSDRAMHCLRAALVVRTNNLRSNCTNCVKTPPKKNFHIFFKPLN